MGKQVRLWKDRKRKKSVKNYKTVEKHIKRYPRGTLRLFKERLVPKTFEKKMKKRLVKRGCN